MNQQLTKEFRDKTMQASDAVGLVKNGDTVYVGTCTSVAYGLLDAILQREGELEDVTLAGGLIIKPAPVFSSDGFNFLTYFTGAAERKNLYKAGSGFTSVHLSQVDIWCRETAKPNVAFLEVSPPDENGYMSLGAGGVGAGTYIIETADTIILQINKLAPYVYGENNLIHISEADCIVYSDTGIAEIPSLPDNEAVTAIGDLLLGQIPDGACIQLGLGGLATVVGDRLRVRNDLGAHSELICDPIMDLMKLGVLNNSRKSFLPGKTVAGCSLGSKALYEFVDHNEDVYFLPFPIVNNPAVIARNDNVISVNTAISIDLFGQVNADNFAGRQYSATGGQLDFVRGAQMSKGGKSFIAIQSIVEGEKSGRVSRIVAGFPQGTAITTPRSDVQYIVTEYGCVNLKPLSMRDRARALISIAHPDFRAQLTDEAKAAGIL